MGGSKFGRLSKLPARQGWVGEAREFTPWLAENLEYLELLQIDSAGPMAPHFRVVGVEKLLRSSDRT